MAYDPQANRRRPRPAVEDPAPVDAILGTARSVGRPEPEVADDPPPSVAVTPEPADPPSDKLLISTGVAGAIGGLIALLTLRHLWRRHRRSAAADTAVDEF